jgi:hypothetical protein
VGPSGPESLPQVDQGEKGSTEKVPTGRAWTTERVAPLLAPPGASGRAIGGYPPTRVLAPEASQVDAGPPAPYTGPLSFPLALEQSRG